MDDMHYNLPLVYEALDTMEGDETNNAGAYFCEMGI